VLVSIRPIGSFIHCIRPAASSTAALLLRDILRPRLTALGRRTDINELLFTDINELLFGDVEEILRIGSAARPRGSVALATISYRT
jgi:hypothetical protein